MLILINNISSIEFVIRNYFDKIFRIYFKRKYIYSSICSLFFLKKRHFYLIEKKTNFT